MFPTPPADIHIYLTASKTEKGAVISVFEEERKEKRSFSRVFSNLLLYLNLNRKMKH